MRESSNETTRVKTKSLTLVWILLSAIVVITLITLFAVFYYGENGSRTAASLSGAAAQAGACEYSASGDIVCSGYPKPNAQLCLDTVQTPDSNGNTLCGGDDQCILEATQECVVALGSVNVDTRGKTLSDGTCPVARTWTRTFSQRAEECSNGEITFDTDGDGICEDGERCSCRVNTGQAVGKVYTKRTDGASLFLSTPSANFLTLRLNANLNPDQARVDLEAGTSSPTIRLCD